MHLYTLIIGIWLLPRGDTLTCVDCYPDDTGTCTETPIQCPSQSYQCGASRSAYYEDGLKEVHEVRTCVQPEICGQHSANFGAFQVLSNTTCCNSTYCNFRLPELNVIFPNGKQCFGGVNLTFEGKILPCEGNQDFCITITGGTTILKGCASKRMCSEFDRFLSSYAGANVSCCEGDLCNSGITTSAGLQLVVVAMVSLALLS